MPQESGEAEPSPPPAEEKNTPVEWQLHPFQTIESGWLIRRLFAILLTVRNVRTVHRHSSYTFSGFEEAAPVEFPTEMPPVMARILGGVFLYYGLRALRWPTRITRLQKECDAMKAAAMTPHVEPVETGEEWAQCEDWVEGEMDGWDEWKWNQEE